MSKVELIEQIQRFGYQVHELPDDCLKIEGQPIMSLTQAEKWVELQKQVQCPECGRYRER